MGQQRVDMQKIVRYNIGDILLVKFSTDLGKCGKEGDRRIAIVVKPCEFEMYALLFSGDLNTYYLYHSYEFSVEDVYAK
jgi:hypothetical protein